MKFKEKVKEKFEDFKYWCDEHKELVMVTTPLIIEGVGRIFVEMSKNRRQKNIDRNRFIEFYDNGHYVKAKRPLKRKELLEFDSKYRKEPTSYILNDMGLLK